MPSAVAASETIIPALARRVPSYFGETHMGTETQDGLVITTSPLPARICRRLLRRVLHRSGFTVIAEIKLLLPSAYPQRTAEYTALVAWNPSLAQQVLQIDPKALMLPLCLILQEEGDAGSKVVALDYRQLVATNPSPGTQVLARIMEFQIRQALWRVADPDSYQAVAKGGGEYRGIQRGSAAKNVPDLVLFDDPATHTTLSLRVGEAPITAEAVRKEIARSRAQFPARDETGTPDPTRDRGPKPTSRMQQVA